MIRPAKMIAAALVCAVSVVALAAPAAAEGEAYEVKPGDFLKGIATKLGVTLPELLAANDLKITSVIHPGDTLIVPPGGTLPSTQKPAVAAPAEPATTPYVVLNGDYLFGVAAKHGVTVGALLKANGLKITSTIQPGETLAIPPRTIPLPAETPSAPAPATPLEAATEAPAQADAPANVDTQPAAPSSSVETVVAYLHQQLGKPYEFNTAGPDTFDCSGLVRAAFLQVGVKLPHYSLLQSTYGTAVDLTTDSIRAGDLVFTFSSASPGQIGHVGVAIDSRRWIQAAGTGYVVRISALPKTIQSVRRLL